jgi:glyoxylase-like metal-dependent hydrolase (beta-lactamase superfamily II)
VPDAQVLVMGDLIEESASPVYGLDSFPLDWPATVAEIEPMLSGDSVVVPGHGAVVDRGFVRRQAEDLTRVATTSTIFTPRMSPPRLHSRTTSGHGTQRCSGMRSSAATNSSDDQVASHCRTIRTAR